MAPFLDDCKLLESLLDDVLRLEVGEDLFQKFDAVRELSRCASQLAAKGDKVGFSCILFPSLHPPASSESIMHFSSQ